MKTKNLETLAKDKNHFSKQIFVDSIVAGLLGAVICIFYRFLLTKAESLYYFLIQFVYSHRIWLPIWFVGLVVLGLFISKFLEWEPDIGGSGIPQVEAEVNGYISQRPLRVILAKIGGGALGVAGGLSLGREGPSIQLGAMAGKLVSRIFKRSKTEEKYLLTSGAAAGLSAAFNAPLAGVLFSIEEVHKRIGKNILISSLCAAILADYVSKICFGFSPTLNLAITQTMPFIDYIWIIALGILCGLFGSFYNWLMLHSIQLYSKIKWMRPSRYVIIPLLISGILGIWMPAAMCGGHQAIESVNNINVTFSFLLLLLMVKFLFSVCSFSSGTAGGIFYPLLVIGALLGALFGKVALYFGVSDTYYINFVLMGTAAMFASIVRAPITGIVLVAEMSGTVRFLLPLVLVSYISYLVAQLIGTDPIYESLLENLLRKKRILKKEEKAVKTKMNTTKYVVSVDCIAAHTTIQDLELPESAWILMVERGQQDLIPNEDLELMPGDSVLFLYDQNKAIRTKKFLEQLFGVDN